MHRATTLLPLLFLLAGTVAAQDAQELPDLAVRALRATDSLATVPASVTIVGRDGLHRGRLAATMDDLLAFVPGVVISNRWNFSLDQRLSVRGFGARANFGLRGVKVLLDGVPQTLPDGQGQLTSVDLQQVARAEVVRGAASAAHGNAAGGIVAFTTAVAPRGRWDVSTAAEGGSFGSSRLHVTGAVRHGALAARASASRLATDGSRQHAAAEQRRFALAVDWAASGSTMLSLRASHADDPQAQNPGALTRAEYEANRDSAAQANILRGADKAVTQQQLALTARGARGAIAWEGVVHALWRDLDNPLATPPPAPAGPAEGTWVAIDRRVGGTRGALTAHLGAAAITGGFDLQQMRDHRTNRRSVGGVAGAALLLDQVERVTEVGPYAQLHLPLPRDLHLRIGARYDAVQFAVDDHHVADGDASGRRAMSAASGHAGMAWERGPATAWVSVSTAFETPTTTELANRIEGDGGFNRQLDPQRSVATEFGVRARSARWQLEGVVHRATTRDALVPFREQAGRTFYRNAGRTAVRGAEAAIRWQAAPWLAVQATWTHTRARFDAHAVPDADTLLSLAGNTLPGIPAHVARTGVAVRRGVVAVDIEHGWSAGVFADDRNTIAIEGWGPGVTGGRLRLDLAASGWTIAPQVAVSNLFDIEYVSAVTINGGFGRVIEPGAGRALHVGVTIGAAR